MNSDNNQGRDCDVREKIVSLMRSIGQGPRKPIPGGELQKLKSAAGRLDQMLKNAANTEREAMRNAMGRLDQLLADIGLGKDVTVNLKRPRTSRNRDE